MTINATDLLAAFEASQVTAQKSDRKARKSTTLADLLNGDAPKDAAVLLSRTSQTGETFTAKQVKTDMRALVTASVREQLLSIAAAATHLAQNVTPDDINVTALTDKSGGKTGNVRIKATVTERETGASFAQASVGVTFGTAHGFALSRYAATAE